MPEEYALLELDEHPEILRALLDLDIEKVVFNMLAVFLVLEIDLAA